MHMKTARILVALVLACGISAVQSAPNVWLSSPTNNAVLYEPASIPLHAEASDTNGIARLEFFAGSVSLGSAHSNMLNMTWTNVPAGSYVLKAVALNNSEVYGTSAPVNITVVSNSLPLVSITVIDSHAAEPADIGVFRLTRTGGTNESLLVNCVIGGTAETGHDYSNVFKVITIPAGALTADILITPIDDTLYESTETVVFSVLNSTNYRAGSPSSATVYLFDNETNQAPGVSVFSPTNGASFLLPTNILLQAEAHDVDGSIYAVNFFRGTNLIGSGTPINTAKTIFNFLWTNPPAGDPVITARAYDNFQKIGTSAPVQITISGNTTSNKPPSVSIYTPTNGSSFHAPTNIVIAVQAADNDGWISTVQFFANGTNLGTVTNYPWSTQPVNPFYLTWFNPQPGTYSLTAKATDNAGAAKLSEPVSVTILSPNPPEPTNVPPAVSITSPTNNELFYAPTNITVTAQAADSDGQVARVDFFVGDHLFASDTTPPYSVIWSNTATGNYNLSARATDNNGATAWASAVHVTIKSAAELSFVSRSVPLWYVPGVKTTVRLIVNPKTNTVSYSVQDTPPAGWTINTVGENGSMDTGGQSVTFGPFNDKLPRTLIYTVTPPVNESGEKRFIGTGTANDLVSPIVGVNVMIPPPPHPAETNAPNFSISTNELSAYVLAWKRCERWPISPSPVPLNYVTRAGYLVAGGGGYSISTNYPTPLPPLIWVRNASDITAGTLSNSVPWTTDNHGSAVASMPTNYTAGGTFTVTINVSPISTCSAYGLEDRPPEGWIVSNVSDGGFFCPILKRVKWGVFLDHQPRTVSYQVTATTNLQSIAYFSGVVSFDGINVPITGTRRTYLASGSPTTAKLQSVVTTASGDRIFTFIGQPGVVYRLEGTTDFINWTPMEELLNNDGVLHYTDPASSAFANRFYRTVPVEQD